MSTPITCLGKTFATEDERRSYFIDELRKQLPELRKIEGFPIGTDDDILNLSDPPYYTACPNPWLNDFIAQWEEEKKGLEKDNKRKADFEVHEPYASDVSEGKNNPIYNAHSYHTKVPHPAIMRYILHYTQPGDIVFDGFAGTGMTGVAAQYCAVPTRELKYKIESEFEQMGLNPPNWGARKAICGDLSPIASFIGYNYNAPISIEKFEFESRRILNEIKSECGWMYSTTHSNGRPSEIKYTILSDVFLCPNCGSEIVLWNAAINKDKGEVLHEFPCSSCNIILNRRKLERAYVTVFDPAIDIAVHQAKTVPVLINYVSAGKRFEKIPDENDLSVISKIAQMEVPYWYPCNELPKGDKMNDPFNRGIKYVHQFYTKRNLYTIALFFNIISKISSDTRLKKYLQLWFTASLNRLDLLNRYAAQHKRHVGPLSNTLYVSSTPTEISPLYFIESKIKDLTFLNKVEYSNLSEIHSATSLNHIMANSIDYIFTDPPFGANIMYSELNYYYEAWNKVLTNNSQEALQNDTQKKSIIDYKNLMAESFKSFYRILKPGKWMTVEFSNTSASVWNAIQYALTKAGFVISNVAAIDKGRPGLHGIIGPVAVKQDLIISCYKPSNEFEKKFSIESGEVNVLIFVEEHLKHLPVSIIKEGSSSAIVERSPRIIYDRLITFYLMRNLPIPIDALAFQIKLKQKFVELDGMIFTSDQAAEYDKEKILKGITQQLSLVFDIIYSENDAIEWLKGRIAKVPQTYQDIQPDFRKANRATRKGEKEFELKNLLDENFIEMADGRWRMPDNNEAKDREALRNKSLLKEFGKYIDELANPKTKKLKDVRVDALRAGFKSCWEKKEFTTIVNVAEKIPQNLLMEDEQLLMFYDIAKDKV